MKKIFLLSLAKEPQIKEILIPLISFGAGLVPCGGPNENPCTACDIIVLIEKILHFALNSGILIIIGAIIWGGIIWITSMGEKKKIAQGKQIIQSAIIGLIIVLASYIIINTTFWVLAKLGGDDYTGTWLQLECNNPIINTENENRNWNENNNGNEEKNGGKNYQYGDACRAQTFPPYDCHLPENCCYLNTDCDMP